MPAAYGFVEVTKSQLTSNFSIVFYRQVSGTTYRKSGHNSDITDWMRQVKLEDVDVENTADTIVQRDSYGHIKVANRIYFANGDYIAYDDGDNEFRVSTDGSAEKKVIHEGNLRSFRVTITPVANTPTYATLSYGVDYGEQPMIVATPVTSVPGSTVKEVSVSSTDNTNCRIYIYRSNTTTTAINVLVMKQT